MKSGQAMTAHRDLVDMYAVVDWRSTLGCEIDAAADGRQVAVVAAVPASEPELAIAAWLMVERLAAAVGDDHAPIHRSHQEIERSIRIRSKRRHCGCEDHF